MHRHQRLIALLRNSERVSLERERESKDSQNEITHVFQANALFPSSSVIHE